MYRFLLLIRNQLHQQCEERGHLPPPRPGHLPGRGAIGGRYGDPASYDLAQEIPTHLSAIAVADYRDSSWVHAGATGDIPVTLTGKPADLNAMVSRFGDLGGAIDACEFWYGPYEYERVGYVLTTDGALEIPTNVAYPDFMPGQNSNANRALYTHELGHHWWGDVVTPYVHNDMWLKEGPAEYAAHLVVEWVSGRDAFVSTVKNNLLDIMTTAHLDDGGFQPLSPMPDPYIYGTHTYNEALTISFSQALSLTGLSRNTLYNLLKAGKVPGARKLGNTWRFHRATLLGWLGHQDS